MTQVEYNFIWDALDACNKACSVQEALVTVGDNLFLLPASQQYRWEELGRKKYRKLIEQVEPLFDYIFLDCPAGIGRGTETLVSLSSRHIIVTDPTSTALRAAERVMSLFNRARHFDYAVVLNRVQSTHINTEALYGCLDRLQAERYGAILPWSEEIQAVSEGTHYQEELSELIMNLLEPLLTFIQSGESEEDYKLVNWLQNNKASQESIGVHPLDRVHLSESKQLLIRQRQSAWRRRR